MNNYDFILDEMTWSYSRLSEFINCPKAFYLNYIQKKEGIDNAFGQYGSFIHKLHEDYLNGDLFLFELSDHYKDNFTSKVTAYFPPMKNRQSMAEIYYNKGLEYFDTFQGFNHREILDIEQKFNFKINKYNFVGIIDLITKNKNNEYEIIDHKTTGKKHTTRLSNKLKQNGYISLINETKKYVPFELFVQQYIYCIPFKNKYGFYPNYLSLNMCNINDLYTIEFNKDDFDKSIQWCINTIENIYKETVFNENNNQFYCDFICGQGLNCKYSSKYNIM